MNETGKNIVEGFRELRKFCKDVGLLLQTANGMMEKGGCTCTSNRPVAIQVEEKLDSSEFWLPDTFFCFYEYTRNSSVLPFISVVVDDLLGEPQVQVDEALITAGWIDYGSGVNAVEKWKKDYSASYVHVWMETRKKVGKRTDDGAWHEGDAHEILDDDIPEGVIVRTFARPLVEITDSDALKAKIASPLLAGISRAGTTRAGKSRTSRR